MSSCYLVVPSWCLREPVLASLSHYRPAEKTTKSQLVEKPKGRRTSAQQQAGSEETDSRDTTIELRSNPDEFVTGPSQ